jgi:high affinity Mn2+ porin
MSPENATSHTTTLYLGMRINKSLELYFNPEVSGGKGISGAVGLGGFSNGETFRIGSAKPALYPARIFLKYTYNLSEPDIYIPNAQNQIAGKIASERIFVILGKFGIADYFDNNSCTHDPRQQFCNWALMNSGAWDYPADTRGYTSGFLLGYCKNDFEVQLSGVLEPERANGLMMDTRINKAHGLAIEVNQAYQILGKHGQTGFLLFLNKARMGSYNDAVNLGFDSLDLAKTRMYSRIKFGFALSVSQTCSESGQAFLRFSWNDGKTETWAFTEIDRSIALGYSVAHLIFSDRIDEAGIALVVNRLSGIHEQYLEKGGTGFMIGDGQLNYATENILETYYKIAIREVLSLSADYQFIIHPAYNKDRGPVHVFGLRAHIEI